MPSRKPAIGNAQPLAWPSLQQRLQDGAAGKHEVGAILADAGLCHPFRMGGCQQASRHGARLLDCAASSRPPACDRSAAARDARRPPSSRCPRCRADACSRSPCARAGDARPRTAPAWPQMSATIAWNSRLVDEPAAVALGQRHHAHRQRRPGHDAVLHFQAVDVLRSRTCACSPSRSSQISSEEPPPISNTSARSQLASMSEAQPDTASRASASRLTTWMSRSVSSRTRLRNCGALSASRQASVAIRPDARDPVMPDLGGTDLQRIDGALDGLLRQAAAGRDALAQADDARERVDDLEAARRRPRNQQAAIVGAQIERRVSAVGIAGLFRADRDRTNGVVERMAIHGWRRNAPFARRGMVRWRNLLLAEPHSHGWRRVCAALIVPLHRPSPAPDLSGLQPPGVFLV